MLEGETQTAIDYLVYRLANPRNVNEALGDLGMSLEEALETASFLGRQQVNPVELLDAPFRTDPSYRPSATRLSDSNWRVFYSALEQDTAEAERAHWCKKNAQSLPPAVRRFHYRQLRCRLNGQGYDVRPQRTAWPFLTGDNTYPQCQALAAEAKERRANAMLCPSARRQGGTTTPVFERNVLSEPVILAISVLQIDPSGKVQITRIS
jgi:RES domain